MRVFARLDRLVLKIALSIALLVLLSVAVGFYLIDFHYRRSLEERFRQNAASQISLIRLALEHQMLQNDRELLHKMANRFAEGPDIERVLILDRQKRIQFSTDPKFNNRTFNNESPACRVCHETEASKRVRSIVLETDGGLVLRGVEPIPNRKACHGCHDPSHRLNGLIIVDVAIARSIRKMETAVAHYAIGAGVLGLVLLVGIGTVFQRFVTRRVRRLRRAAQSYAEGDLSHRVPVSGSDMLTGVESQFNEMAHAVGGLLKQLDEHRASLELVMNSADDGMVVLDHDRRIIAANDAFVRRFETHTDEVIGVVCCDKEQKGGLGCSSSDDALGRCPTLVCFETGEVQVMLRRRRTSEGAQRTEEVIASPVQSEEGVISHVVEVWRDITDRLSTEAKLAETQRLVSIGMLASGISHEVNTPLSTIGACIEGIEGLSSAAQVDKDERWARVLDYAGTAREQVRRCGATTQQLLQLARGRTITREIVDLRATVALVVNLCRKRADDAGVCLDLAPGGEGLSVYASPSAVQQVALNAVLNAIEASASGDTVHIHIEDGSLILVVVSDEGEGIQAADLPKVFEPFFSRKQQGTGLGLFVSMNLARSWGGDILVDSKLGEGTVVEIAFPNPSEESSSEESLSDERSSDERTSEKSAPDERPSEEP